MQKQEKVLVVIDPAEEHHPALERAITNAQIRETAERSHLVLLITPAGFISNRHCTDWSIPELVVI